MLFVTIGFVLAIVVPTVVVCAWLTFETRSALAAWSRSCQDLSERVSALERGAAQTSNAHLTVELAALAGDVEKLAKHVRKQFGSVWAELHHDGTLERNSARQVDHVSRDELRAQLLPRSIGTVPHPKPNGGDT